MVPPVPGAGTRLGGFVCIVASAAGFGAMPIFAKLAYAESVDLPSMLFLRFALAGLMMALLMRVRGMVWPRGRNLLLLVAMGGIGYVAQSFCYFAALQYATASLTALLLYLYPAIVTVLSALLAQRRLSPLRLLAVAAALFGTGLAVGGSLAGSVLGILLGIGAALIYSVYILVGERVTPLVGAMPAATVIMLSAALVFGLIVLSRGAAFPASPAAWAAIGGIALFSTVVAMITFFAGMARLGAADAATLSTLEPVVTVILAAIFLGEAIGSWQIAGGAIILAAVVVLARSSAQQR
ncbi:MAG TPA: DMT family transporter [Accumulibacter sp.]|uniref:DMT family transporter n=2 Tax=Candidatus Accumulibacter TaxID=327159 RepID=A0A080MAN5_9PROT|nr:MULTISPECIES: DMT family transporter [Candidatus Accumulibacter]KFB78372.1 MAG: putative DMT superfamily transporter inner membrane protein [Candidatus Accumulibacter cognatus]MBN8516693.1 DMT family transporter [Accumulibacter sp.]MBO3710800.1 DMT family transporter [Accumulibacter sp.]MCC2868534.1 DMT family transporter [Candidatus Accumulibacter phosphatis]MCM8580513.1 DMT family transporter [Accumulibacter sp.]